MSSANVEYWVDTNVVEMANSAIIRPFNINPDWTTIQLGILHAMTTGSQTTIRGTPRFYMGLCSGGTNVIGDTTTTHFVGYRSNQASWLYVSSSANTNEYMYHQTGQFVKKVGTTLTNTIDPIATCYHFLAVPPDNPKKSGQYLQITKGSPNYSFKMYYMSSAANALYGQISENTFLKELQSSVPTTGNGLVLAASPTYTLAVDESVDGYFNHINIAWDREDPVGNQLIYAIGLAVLA